jgi:hypothetical protein
MGQVLKMLLGYLTGSDARTLRLAVETLRAVVLEVEEGSPGGKAGGKRAAALSASAATPQRTKVRAEMAELLGKPGASGEELGELTPHDRHLLQSFAASTSRPRERRPLSAFTATTPAAAAGDCWAEALWDPTLRPFASWITTLTSTLIREGVMPQEAADSAAGKPRSTPRRSSSSSSGGPHAVGPTGAEEVAAARRFVVHCADAAAAQPALAEALLPLVILSLVRGAGAGSPRSLAVADRMAECLRRCLPRAGPRALQALIAALNFLRAHSVHESALDTAHPLLRRSSASASKNTGAAGAFPGVAVFGFYMPSLSKLEVARAALRCGALTSAALYLELHLEDLRQERLRGKGLRDADDSALAVMGGGAEDEQASLLLGETSVAQSLLLQISSRLSEPDGAAATVLQVCVCVCVCVRHACVRACVAVMIGRDTWRNIPS